MDALARRSIGSDNFEVIVVNNDPADDEAVTHPALRIRLIVEKRTGSYASRNAGLAASTTSLLAFTDAGCDPFTDWLELAERIRLLVGIGSSKRS